MTIMLHDSPISSETGNDTPTQRKEYSPEKNKKT
jgi:hypothetical protein